MKGYKKEDRWNFVLYSETLGASGFRISIAGYGEEGEYSGICANCHRKRKTTGGETENHQIAILKAIEKEWFGLGGK